MCDSFIQFLSSTSKIAMIGWFIHVSIISALFFIVNKKTMGYVHPFIEP